MQLAGEAKARAGRPPLLSREERQQLILDSAEAAFIEAGYGNTTIEEIARRCGMSKKTLYQLYSDKAEIFEALVRSMPAMPDMPRLQGADASDVEKVLTAGLLHFGGFVMSQQQITIMRLVIAESPMHPEVASLFFDICIEQGRRQLASFICELQSVGALTRACDATTLADMLFGATIATPHIHYLIHPAGDKDLEGRAVIDKIESDIRKRLHPLLVGLQGDGGRSG
jgi:AcrR family transcriptional regulator